jgi:hypothetical protein
VLAVPGLTRVVVTAVVSSTWRLDLEVAYNLALWARVASVTGRRYRAKSYMTDGYIFGSVPGRHVVALGEVEGCTQCQTPGG